MKKIIAILISLVFLFSLAACGDKEAPKTEGDEALKNSIAESVSVGKIPEVKYAIGTASEEIDKYYADIEKQMEEAHEGDGNVHSDDDMMLNSMEGYLSYTYEIGTEKYFYEKAKKAAGISVICSLEDAFGIKQGTSKSEVEAALTGLELQTLQASEEELYFVPLIEAIVLRYKSGDYRLDFYFSNNELVATVLINTKNWTI